MCPPALVNSSGTIVRERKGLGFSPQRVLFIVVILAALIVTNPANQIEQWVGISQKKQQSTNDDSAAYTSPSSLFQSASSFLDSFLSTVGGQRETNYLLFSLRNDGYDGIYAQALTRDFLLCRHDEYSANRFESICPYIETQFCHGIDFDLKNQRPFSAHRILEFLLLLSALSIWCSRSGWFPPEPSYKRPIATLVSVLWFPSLIEDVIACNVFIYPALVRMDRILSMSAQSDGQAIRRFYLSVLALMLGIGGLANLVSTLLSRRANFGMHGATAASLGYLLATAPNMVIIRYLGLVSMYASDILFAITAIGLIDALLGIQIPLLRRISRHSVFAWMIGGVLGNMFGQFHLDRYTSWWFPFR